MADSFKVTYGVDDGYVGGNRPHTISIREDDFEEGDDLSDLFWELIQNDFEQSVHPYSSDEAEFLEWAEGVIAKRKAEGES